MHANTTADRFVDLTKRPSLVKNTRGEHFPGSRATNTAFANLRGVNAPRQFVEVHG